MPGRAYRGIGKHANKARTGLTRSIANIDYHNPFCRVRNCPHELHYSVKE